MKIHRRRFSNSVKSKNKVLSATGLSGVDFILHFENLGAVHSISEECSMADRAHAIAGANIMKLRIPATNSAENATFASKTNEAIGKFANIEAHDFAQNSDFTGFVVI